MTQRRIYQSNFPYFITIRMREGFRLFDDVRHAELLARDIFVSSKLKGFDVYAYQIMPDHVHLLAWESKRTLEKVRLGDVKLRDVKNISHIPPSEPSQGCARHSTPPTISDLIQSIKGNFSRRVHMGNIWQRRFYTRIIDTDRYLHTVIEYIRHNPVKAELPSRFSRVPYQLVARSILE